jgi:predicted CopG family antitoxin
VKSLKPGLKPKRYKDGQGLFLLITETGRKRFEYRFRFYGRESSLGLGSYPETSLAEARQQHQAALEQLRQGINPVAKRKAVVVAEKTAGTSFAEVAKSYVEHRKSLVLAGKLRGDDTEDRLRRHLMKRFGPLPIAEIRHKQVLDFLMEIYSQGKAATVEKLRSILRGVFRHAILRMGLTITNPMLELKNIDELKGAPQKPFRYAETPEALGRILLASKSGEAHFQMELLTVEIETPKRKPLAATEGGNNEQKRTHSTFKAALRQSR